MGSVIDYVKCNKCGRESYEDYYYKTGEEYKTCVACGKSKRHFMKRENGEVIFDENNVPVWVHEQNEGFGTCYLEDSNGIGSLSILKSAITQENIKEFFELLKQEGINKEKCRLTSWDDEKKELVSLYGEIPEEFPEMDE